MLNLKACFLLISIIKIILYNNPKVVRLLHECLVITQNLMIFPNNKYLDPIGLLMPVRSTHMEYFRLLTGLKVCKILVAHKILISRLMATLMELWEDHELLAKVQRLPTKIKLSTA